MRVIPAIDLRDGKCVRMRQGDPTTSTVYDEDPVERAKAFVDAGASMLHVVDLDSAFGLGENFRAIENICKSVDVPVQTGGGIRTIDHAKARLDAGAAAIILGTLLVEEERVARNIIARFGDAVIAGIDARGDMVMTRGWQEGTPVNRDALIKRVAAWGVRRVIFTEVGRDGMGHGYDIEALRHIATLTELPITASGGAKTLDDLKALRDAKIDAVDSCIVGSALYTGTLDLREALANIEA